MSGSSLNDFLGRNKPNPLSVGTDRSLTDFLKTAALPPVPKEAVPEAPAPAKPVDIRDDEVVQEIHVVSLKGDKTSQGISTERAQAVVGHVKKASSSGLIIDLPKSDKLTIPQFSDLIAQAGLEEILALFGNDRQAIRWYLSAKEPKLSRDKLDFIYDAINVFLRREPTFDELHPSFQRTLPAPSVRFSLSTENPWLTFQIYGSAPGANSIAVVGSPSLRFKVEAENDYRFSGSVILSQDISSGIIVYSLNTKTSERSEASPLGYIPPEPPKFVANYFEMIGVLDRQDAHWIAASKKSALMPANSIVYSAETELVAAKKSNLLEQVTIFNGTPRLLSKNQHEVLMRVLQ